jgi:hypothetical protein
MITSASTGLMNRLRVLCPNLTKEGKMDKYDEHELEGCKDFGPSMGRQRRPSCQSTIDNPPVRRDTSRHSDTEDVDIYQAGYTGNFAGEEYNSDPFNTQWTHDDPLRDSTESRTLERGDKGILASKRQVGGDHYKSMVIQPGDFIVANNLGWYEGNAIKYICRHDRKGGLKDIEKAIHYLQLLQESRYKYGG